MVNCNNVYVSAVTTDNVSRTTLVAWVNSLLQAQLSKIEEMSTGAAYCQLTHLLWPDNISLKRVKWNSKNEMDHLNNWKILGIAWKDIGVDKPIQVEKLVKGKFQDNFEFLQWFYKFFYANAGDFEEGSYEALAHRGGESLPVGAKGPSAVRPALRPAPTFKPSTAPKKAPSAVAPVTRAAPASANKGLAADKEKIAELEELVAMNMEAIQVAERERDFYFQKLRQIEDMCNALTEDQQLNPESVLAVLYLADDIPVGEEGLENVAPSEIELTAAAPNLDDSETF